MDIDVILCNHAEVAENKLFVTGGGINMCFVQPMPPHVVSVALGCVVHVPYLATNQGHTLEISLVDADGAPIVPWVPEGMPTPEPVKATQGFNMGRPPLIQMGDEQTMSFAVNFTNLPLESAGLYELVVQINEDILRRMPFRVTPAPPGMFPVMPAAPAA